MTDAELKVLEPDEDMRGGLGQTPAGRQGAALSGPSLNAALVKQSVRAVSMNQSTPCAPPVAIIVLTLRAGVPVYADRNYRITVGALLQGRRLSNRVRRRRARQRRGTGIALRYPATVWLADDARRKQLPTWMRQGWTRTG